LDIIVDQELLIKVNQNSRVWTQIFRGKKVFFSGFSSQSANVEGEQKFEFVVELPQLEEGDYSVKVNIFSEDNSPIGGPFYDSFEIKKWEWEGNSLGISEDVIPPFTPLKVSGNKVSMVLREYKFGGMGFPVSIKSEGEEILSAPIELKVSVSNKIIPISNKKFRFRKKAPNEVIIDGSGNVRNLKIFITTVLEYDGFMKVMLSLYASSPVEVDRLSLIIPVKEKIASLMHSVGDGIRSNYAGFIPKGTGRVWDSTMAFRRYIKGTFSPYLWIGRSKRGICWMADWDKNWSLATWDESWLLGKKKTALELIRDNKTVQMRVNFINKPTEINKRRDIIFGIQATPVKPMPKGWRRWTIRGLGDPYEKIYLSAHTTTWGGRAIWGDIYPINRDYELLRRMMMVKGTGSITWKNIHTKKEILDFVEKWQKKYGLDEKKTTESKRFLAAGFINSSCSKYFVPYTNAQNIQTQIPEFQYFQTEWVLRPRRGTSIETGIALTRSYQDMALWSIKKMIEAGVDGIYLDNTMPRGNLNWAAGLAYIMENGEIQPNCGLFAMREYVKRIRTLFYQMGKEQPLIIVHMTNALVIPCFSFATIQYDWEWKRGITPHPERFSLDFVRAESIGLQAGLAPFCMEQIQTGSKELRKSLQRSFWALALPHGIKGSTGGITDYRELYRPDKVLGDFAYWEEDCTFVPYWEIEKRKEIISSRKLLLSYYKKPDKVMLICSNIEKEKSDFTITINRKKLGLGSRIKVSDPCDNKPVLWLPDKSQIRLTIPGYDYRMILLENVM